MSVDQHQRTVNSLDKDIADLEKKIVKHQTLRAVFCDSSFQSRPVKINVIQIFKELEPDTSVKVL